MKTDLRVLRTQKAIREAFLQLLNQKDYKEISVREILERAMVNRMTFYKYYSGIDDLVAKLIAEFKAFYAQSVYERFTSPNVAEFLQNNLPAFQEKIPLMLALQNIQTKRHHLYQDQLDLVKTVFLEKFAATAYDEFKDYQATMFAMAVVGTERYYAERGEPLPAEKLPEQWRHIAAALGGK